jgi:hypothetical protein
MELEASHEDMPWSPEPGAAMIASVANQRGRRGVPVHSIFDEQVSFAVSAVIPATWRHANNTQEFGSLMRTTASYKDRRAATRSA